MGAAQNWRSDATRISGIEAISIPEGWLRIVRRFNAGFEVAEE